MRLLSCSTPCCEILDVRTPPIRTVSWVLPRLHAAFAAALILGLCISPAAAAPATGTYSAQPVFVFGIPVDFILFGLTLLGVAIFHHKTLQVALTGLAVVTVYKLLFTGFRQGEGFSGLVLQMHHEWVILANLFLLLMGFAILSRHFENSRIPDEMPAFLPDGWARRARIARHRIRAVELPRQHRGSPDRRHDGASRVQGQSPYRLSRRHRRGVERRRIRQRGRRHHHDDDVDRRHQPAVGRRSLCRRDCGLPDLRHSGRAPAAPPVADREGRTARPADRVDPLSASSSPSWSSPSWPTSSPI